MNKNFLIVNANYYKDISSGLLKSAIKASNFLKFLEIVIGISKTPGTFIILILQSFGIKLFALLTNPDDISL